MSLTLLIRALFAGDCLGDTSNYLPLPPSHTPGGGHTVAPSAAGAARDRTGEQSDPFLASGIDSTIGSPKCFRCRYHLGTGRLCWQFSLILLFIGSILEDQYMLFAPAPLASTANPLHVSLLCCIEHLCLPPCMYQMDSSLTPHSNLRRLKTTECFQLVGAPKAERISLITVAINHQHSVPLYIALWKRCTNSEVYLNRSGSGESAESARRS